MAVPAVEAVFTQADIFTPALPLDVASTDLPQALLEDLLARTLLDTGVADIRLLADVTRLSSKLLDTLIQIMRQDARVESHSPGASSPLQRFALTDAGRLFALEAKSRSSYSGPAPISANHYREMILHQAAAMNDDASRIDAQAMHRIFKDIHIDPGLMDDLGAAMNSGRAMFIYGPAGTGKTFICKRLIELLQTPVYIPHAVAVGDSIVSVYDPAIHQSVETVETESAFIADQPDPRLVLCKRPFVCSGGELTENMLEIAVDPRSGQFNAPLQLKATHGIFMIDDLGRQKMPTGDLFNRWIVPMESREDFLGLPSGHRLSVPFDVLLVFSTNLNPDDLDDPAFQRRVGHKIKFDAVKPDVFRAIWEEECLHQGVGYDVALVDYAIEKLLGAAGQPLLASQPRDLIRLALDFSHYANDGLGLTKAGLQRAWHNYRCESGGNRVNL